MCLYGKAGKQHRSWFKGQRADEMIEIVEKKEWKKWRQRAENTEKLGLNRAF